MNAGPGSVAVPNSPANNGANGLAVPDGAFSGQFFSAKSVTVVPTDSNGVVSLPSTASKFDPKAESPSIRKTPGIDHSTSKPVARNLKHVAGKDADEAQPKDHIGGFSGSQGAVGLGMNSRQGTGSIVQGGNMANPALSGPRQIGAPGGAGSPLVNKGAFRPPTVKRPQSEAGGRPPLTDVSTNGSMGVTGPDAKRLKTT